MNKYRIGSRAGKPGEAGPSAHMIILAKRWKADGKSIRDNKIHRS